KMALQDRLVMRRQCTIALLVDNVSGLHAPHRTLGQAAAGQCARPDWIVRSKFVRRFGDRLCRWRFWLPRATPPRPRLRQSLTGMLLKEHAYRLDLDGSYLVPKALGHLCTTWLSDPLIH